MRIQTKNWKKGLVKLSVETADDLWYLYTIVDAGDVCTGDSEYKYKLPSGKSVRKRVWVSLTVEKTEFSQHTGQLRISGAVVDGAEEVPRGSHHGLEISDGSRLTIVKENWLEYHKEKLKEAVNSGNLKTLLVLFDRENALFALLKPNGHEKLLEMKGDVNKKGVDEVKTGSFYKQIVKQLEEYVARYDVQRAVAASPSFWTEYLRKELTPELTKKVVFAPVSSVDETAISELLKRPELTQALEGERSAREAEIVERMMEALAKDKLVYGKDDLQAMLTEGNLSELAVTEKQVMKTRADDTFAALENLMRAASDLGAKVHLLSTDDAMQKIDGLGGVAGVKRW